VLLLSLTAGMLPILGWRAEIRWGLMVAGFMSFAVADTVYLFQTSAGAYLEGTWRDALWPIASPCIPVAGWPPASGGTPPAEARVGRVRARRPVRGSRARGGRLGQPESNRRGVRRSDVDRRRLAVRRHVSRRERDGGSAPAGHDRRVDGPAEPDVVGD